MTQKFKFIPKLIGVLAFFMLTNCSKDEFVKNIQNSKDKNNISFEQFKRETGLNNFDTNIKIPKYSISTDRNADGSYEISDFEIDTELIKRLDLNSKTTYTFRIVPKDEIPDKSIYNLTVYQKNGIWEKSIVEFIPTDENYQQLLEGTSKQIQGNIKFIYQSEATLTPCTTIVIVTYHCTHHGGPGTGEGSENGCDECTACVTVRHYTFCTTDEEGNFGGDGGVPIESPDGGNNDSPYSGGGSTSTGNGTYTNDNTGDDSIGVIPNLENLEADIDGNPNTIDDATNIKRLKKLTRNGTPLKDEIDLLKSKLTTNHREEGIMYSADLPPLDGASTKNETKWFYSIPTTYFVTVHMHQNTYYKGNTTTLAPSNPVMSPEDVTSTLGLYKNNNNINTTSVLVSRQGTFAIRISDATKVLNAYNTMFPPNPTSNEKSQALKDFENEYDRLVMKPFEKIPSDEAGALAGFIEFINTFQINGQHLGISFYQAVFDTQGNIINWVKL